jgi:hypothetical protein
MRRSAQESWSSNFSRIEVMAFASSCSFNRYYDPSTDQFLSVDPDVQETDQPYLFVNDDPLNSTDPRVLSGHIAAPKCTGVHCGGDVITDAQHLYVHLVIGMGGCIAICFDASIQHGTLTLSAGGVGADEKGPYIGYANLPPTERSTRAIFVQGDYVAGGAASVGLKSNNQVIPVSSIDRQDWEADVGPGLGLGGGESYSVNIPLSKIFSVFIP